MDAAPPAEKTFLLRCLQALLFPERVFSELEPASIRRLDWKWILSHAAQQGLAGFICHVVEQQDLLRCLKPQRRVELGSLALWNSQAQREKQRQFAQLNEALESRGIPVIPLKGLALSYLIYDDMPYRTMADLDILVREADLERTLAALRESGFEEIWAHYKNRWHAQLLTPLLGRTALRKDALWVDVHWEARYQAADRFLPIGCAEMWRRAVPYPELGKNAFMLAHDDQVLWLLKHALDLSCPSLLQALDVLLYAKQYCADLDRPLRAAASWTRGDQRAAAYVRMLKELRDPTPGRRAFSAEAIAACELCLATKKPGGTGEHSIGGWSKLRSMPSLRDRLLLLAGYLIPDPDFYRDDGPVLGLLKHWAALAAKPFKLAAQKARTFARPSRIKL